MSLLLRTLTMEIKVANIMSLMVKGLYNKSLHLKSHIIFRILAEWEIHWPFRILKINSLINYFVYLYKIKIPSITTEI